MKTFLKYFKWVAVVVLAIILSIMIWINYHDSTFLKKNVVLYTGVKEFIVKYQYSDNHQSFIETTISNKDKQMLLKKFKFDSTLVKLKYRMECTFISETPNYNYYVIEDGYGPYGYIVIALEKMGNTMKIFEEYGD